VGGGLNLLSEAGRERVTHVMASNTWDKKYSESGKRMIVSWEQDRNANKVSMDAKVWTATGWR